MNRRSDERGTRTGDSRVLRIGAPALVLLTIVAAPVLGRLLDSLPAVLSLSVLYWVGCWSLALAGSPRGRLRALYRTSPARRPLELLLTWVPPVMTFSVVFVAAAPRLPAIALGGVILIAAVNGFTEELLWRGAFVATYRDDLWLAYLYPAALFAAWHVALALVPGVRYDGGPLALIGGGALLGLAWGLVVVRTRDLRSVTIAHVLTNVFAFSGLALTNWVD